MTENRQNAQFRLGNFNFIKGVGVILFALSHSITRYSFSQNGIFNIAFVLFSVIGVGARTAFYLISGLTFKEMPLKKMLQKTFRSLLIPYFWVMLAYAFLFPLVRYPFMPSWREVFTYATRYVAAFLLGNIEYGKVVFGFEIYWCTPMYFFLSMFIAFNLLNIILKMKNNYAQHCLVVCCIIVGTILLSKKMYLFSIAYGLPAVGFCYVGYLIKKYGVYQKLQHDKRFYLVLIIAFLIGIAYYRIEYPYFSANIIVWITSTLTAILLLFINDYIDNRDWGKINWLRRIGSYSYWIICIHSFETEAIPWFMFTQHFREHQILAFLLELFIKVIIITCGCVILKKIAKMRYKRKVNLYAR